MPVASSETSVENAGRARASTGSHRAQAGASQEALRIECPLPVAVVGGQVLVRLRAVGPDLLVLRRAPGAVERLELPGRSVSPYHLPDRMWDAANRRTLTRFQSAERTEILAAR